MPDQTDLTHAAAAATLGDKAGVVPRRQRADPSAMQMAWKDAENTSQNQITGPATDPTHSHWLHKLDLAHTAKVFWGRVVDSLAYVQGYKVQVEHGLPTIMCTMGAQTSLQPTGVKEYGQLQPGTPVYFLLHPRATHGVIISVDPDYATNPLGSRPDFVSQSGRSGMSVDDAHSDPLYVGSEDYASDIGDYSAGRPYDQTTAGERGWMAETGVGVHADSFMAFLRADEEAGVWAFWHDQMLRVTGHNLQLWSACRERDDTDDCGQVDSVEGYTPYFWEGLGAWAPGGASPAPPPDADPDTLSPPFADLASGPIGDQAEGDVGDAFRLVDPAAWQQDAASQCYSGVEPALDDQQGFYRLRDFHGYLGQASKRVLQIPPQYPPEGPVLTYGEELVAPCVYEANLALPGDSFTRTSRGFSVVKRAANPSPKRMRAPSDPLADTPEDYKAAGTLGDGPGHAVAADLPVSTDEEADPSAVRAAGFLDSQAYAFNWQGAHPFAYARRTWYLPEESDLDFVPDTPAPPFGALAASRDLAAPAPAYMYVDDRYGEVAYYPNVSYLALLPDGAVKVGCGWGAEIQMVNGHLYIDAPGDINIRSGRNVNISAGRDVCVTGNHSVDVVANDKDVRVAANHGVYVVGGLDGCGGVLVESQAVGPALDFSGVGEDVALGGVVIKARTSMVGVCAPVQEFLLADTATPEQWGGTTPTPPSMLVDAGTGRVRASADVFERFIGSAAFDAWGGGATVNEYWANASNFGTPVSVHGCLVVDGAAVVNGAVDSLSGGFFAPSGTTTVQAIADTTPLTAMMTALESRAAAADTMAAAEHARFQVLLAALPIDEAEFSFRDQAQYLTADYTEFEARWQRMNRLGGSAAPALGVWEVNGAFTADGTATYPYPGEPWVAGTPLRLLDPLLYDDATGLSADRGDGAYEDAAMPESYAVGLDGNRTCIVP